MKPIATLRQFWAGVCKVPAQLDLILEAVENYDPQGWQAAAREAKSIRLQLETERDRAVSAWGAAEGKLRAEIATNDVTSKAIVYAESRIATIEQQLAAEREASAKLVEANRLLAGDFATASRELEAEREAQSQLVATIDRAETELEETTAQLSAARADLDALTRWRRKDVEPLTELPHETCVQWSSGGTSQGGLAPYDHIKNFEYWRFTPESLAAWKARKGAGE